MDIQSAPLGVFAQMNPPIQGGFGATRGVPE
jgi:hypothetical protein